mmetsp:Transcript_32757/g.110342  ORF Transcript_32757/g.110342 Transcript_32757/m.110342 type:complete len:240 (+) Transcript_32757:313-1032(+)
MIFVASKPPITGMTASIQIKSKAFPLAAACLYTSTAAAPVSAWSQSKPSFWRTRASSLRLMWTSSATKAKRCRAPDAAATLPLFTTMSKDAGLGDSNDGGLDSRNDGGREDSDCALPPKNAETSSLPSEGVYRAVFCAFGRGDAAEASTRKSALEATFKTTEKENVDPSPRRDRQPIVPPWSWTTCFAIANPRPDPRPSCSSPGRICEKAVNKRFWSSSLMPTPASLTSTRSKAQSASP